LRPADHARQGFFIWLSKDRYTESMTNDSARRAFPLGIIIGVAVGIALGVALKSIAIGIGVGACLAVLFGLVLDRRERDSS